MTVAVVFVKAAGKIAGALQVNEITFISDVPGVIIDCMVVDKLKDVEVDMYIDSGVISSGMIPKVQAALDALAYGAKSAIITDLSGFAHNAGTRIIKG